MIRVAVDPTNPGQFFACCGLLELANRLWPGAEGWFEKGKFCIACEGTADQLLEIFRRGLRIVQAGLEGGVVRDPGGNLVTRQFLQIGVARERFVSAHAGGRCGCQFNP